MIRRNETLNHSPIQNCLAMARAAVVRQLLQFLWEKGTSVPCPWESPVTRTGAPQLTAIYFACSESSSPMLGYLNHGCISSMDKIQKWKPLLGPNPSWGCPTPPPSSSFPSPAPNGLASSAGVPAAHLLMLGSGAERVRPQHGHTHITDEYYGMLVTLSPAVHMYRWQYGPLRLVPLLFSLSVQPLCHWCVMKNPQVCHRNLGKVTKKQKDSASSKKDKYICLPPACLDL